MAVGASMALSPDHERPRRPIMTDPGRWPRVKDIFHSALGRSPQERSAFVHEACRDDTALRQEVESLLAAHADAEGFAETPAIAALADAAGDADTAPAPALAPGVDLGPYR